MRFLKNKGLCFLIGLFIFLPFSQTKAAHLSNNYSLEFSLVLSSTESQFNYGSSTYDTRFKKWGINWYEPFFDYFQAGLEIGNIEMTQSVKPSSQYTTGEYAGVLLRLLPFTSPMFSLSFDLNYRYNSTLGESTNQLTEFIWDEVMFTGQLFFHPMKNVWLYMGADHQAIKGEQRDSGVTNRISTFKESEQKGYRIGIDFIINHTGTVGIERLTGFNSGTRLYFSRKF